MDYRNAVVLKGKVALSTTAIALCALAFAGVLFMEDLRVLTGTAILRRLANCPSKQDEMKSTTVLPTGEEPPLEEEEEEEEEDDGDGDGAEKGAFDPSRFDAAAALEKLRGKRLMFVGDSLMKGQWQSFVCMVEALIPQGKKSLSRGRSLSVFKAKAYNASVEFYWAPFLVDSNSDVPILTDPGRRVLRLDSVAKHARHWVGADILVFGTYVWWKSGQKIKSMWGSFPNGEEGYEELDSAVAYRIGLKTWANWADTTLNPNKSRVFFTTMSPTHMRSADWRRKEGIQCYNESDPITDIGYWGGGSDKRFMQVVASIVGRMRTPVSLLNITQLSEYRKDGHASIYTEPQLGKAVSGDDERKKADPRRRIDCIHWCLPGVPDTWNRILYAHL